LRGLILHAQAEPMTQADQSVSKKPRNILLRLLGPGLVTAPLMMILQVLPRILRLERNSATGCSGTGMLAIPVLAGSAAYGVAEAFGWHATLEAKAPDAVGFYAIIAAATVIGFGLGFTGIDAIHMLVWSAVLNGIVAVPIMAMMMVIVANSRLMGRFRARPWLIGLGWVGSGRD
jgi:hypothetical protein